MSAGRVRLHLSEAAETSLRDALRRWRTRHRVPGAALVLADAAGRSTTIVDGHAELESGTLLGPDHRLQLGSIGKAFTAIAILRLAERGLIDVTKPARHYLPWLRIGLGDARITIHQLLCHASGLPMGSDFSNNSPFDVWTLRELETEPPGRYWYSNVGYKLLGLILERAADRSYGEAIEAEILAPLGMAATSPVITFADRALLATGYEPPPGTWPVVTAPPVAAPYIETATGDGCVASAPADAGRFLSGLLVAGAPGTSLLRPESAARLFGRHARMPSGRWYGYGINEDVVEGLPVFGHGGDMLGFRASLVGSHAAGFGAALLANVRTAPTPDLARYALRLAIADATGGPTPEFPDPVTPDAAEWAGSYGGPSGGLEVTLRDGAPQAVIDGGTYDLIPGEAGRFDIADPRLGRYPLRFQRTRRGRVAFQGGRVFGDPVDAAGESPTSGAARRRRITGRFAAHNPWRRSFDVVARGRGFVVIDEDGEEEPLRSLGGDRFRPGAEPNPERLAFDAVADGRALRALASGHPYYRVDW